MLGRRFRYWLDRRRRESELRAEIEAHLEEVAAELRERGLSAADARAEARRRFGPAAQAQEEARAVWIARYATDLAQDVRYAVRTFARNPGFAAVATLSAALGIGACVTVFSLVNLAVFRPLPVAEPARLLTLSGVKKGSPGGSMSYPEVRDIAARMRSFDGVACFAPFVSAGVRASGSARRHWGFLVSGNYFDVTRSAFALGRGFTPGEDDTPGAPARIVLAHALWRSRFDSDPSIVGRVIHVNKRAMTVVGVTAPAFRGTEVGVAPDFFLPLAQISELDPTVDNRGRLTAYGSQWLTGLARLRPGLDPRQAQAELKGVAVAVRAASSQVRRDRAFHVERAGQLTPFLRRMAIPAFLLLLVVTVLVLLTACANIANLMLARASARGREIATRLAIGAGRGRLIRQLLTESLLLSLTGAALGVLLAAWGGRRIAALRLPLPIPLDLTPTVDARVLFFSLALAVVTGLAFGLAPALRSTRPDPIALLRAAGAAPRGRRRLNLRNILVVTQVGVSGVLLVCSGLFLRSLEATRRVDIGMNPRDLSLIRLDPALSRYERDSTARLLADVLREAAVLPGARSASVTTLLPLSLGGDFTEVGSGGAETERTAVMTVGPRYFETMGIRLLSGADFAPAPSGLPVAIVNQELARRLFPGQDALGREVVEGGRRSRIVAVAANSKYRVVQEAPTPILYRPILDAGAAQSGFGGLTLLVRTEAGAAPVAERVRQWLVRRDPDLVVHLEGTMETHLDQALFLPRLAAALFGLCGAMGLLISSIGVYGVISFTVARRTREIGVRVALGGRAAQVVGMVLRQGTTLVLVGAAAGVVGGLALARAASSLLYGVSASDPLTFIAAPLMLLVVGLLAAAVPARRAAAIDPNLTLRAE